MYERSGLKTGSAKLISSTQVDATSASVSDITFSGNTVSKEVLLMRLTVTDLAFKRQLGFQSMES